MTKGCVDMNVYIVCESDDVTSDVIVDVTFSVASVDPTQPSAVLNQLLPGHVTTQLQFQRDCGADAVCEADLQVEISLDSSGPLLLGDIQNVTSLVTLRNRGEAADSTRLIVTVPGCLQFRSVSDNSSSAACSSAPCLTTRPQ
ncbi:integrin alpha-V-like [Lampetra fluviatilis]